MKPLIKMIRPALLLGLLLCATGCGPAADEKISVRSQADYELWASQTAGKLPPDDARIFQTAQQEIKLNIMANTTATGADAISDEFLAKVNGLTVHQMMVLGLQDRLARIKGEHDEAQRLFTDNSKIQTHPGDTASADYVANRVNEDRTRLERSTAALAATQADLDRIKK